MTERVLQGPFLTRADAALYAGILPQEVAHRPDLLRIGGTHLEEAYFAFQFAHHGVVRPIGTVVQTPKAEYDDLAIADWLVRPHPSLRRASPLAWLLAGGTPDRVVEAAGISGPIVDEEPSRTTTPAVVGREAATQTTPKRQRTRKVSRRHHIPAGTH